MFPAGIAVGSFLCRSRHKEPQVSIEFDHRVISRSLTANDKFPECVELYYQIGGLKKLVCFKQEITYGE